MQVSRALLNRGSVGLSLDLAKVIGLFRASTLSHTTKRISEDVGPELREGTKSVRTGSAAGTTADSIEAFGQLEVTLDPLSGIDSENVAFFQSNSETAWKTLIIEMARKAL